MSPDTKQTVGGNFSLMRTLDEAPLGLFHLLAVLTAGVGFFADAYDLFIIGPALVLINGLWHPSASSVAILGGSSLAAAFLGAVIFGRLADLLGRKRIYGIEAALMVLGSLGSALAPDMGWLIAARVLLGVGIGGDYPVSAVLIAEYANRSNRGRLVASVFSMQALGLIAGPVVALVLLAAGIQHELLWRILLGAGALPAAAVIYRRRHLPESPRFVAKVSGESKQAARDLAIFSSGELSLTEPNDGRATRLTLRKFLTNRRYLTTLIGTAGTWFLLDYAYYGNTISMPLILHTVDHDASLTSTLAWTLIIFAAAAVPGYLLAVLLMDRIGHRRLQIVGFVGMGVTFVAIGAIPGIVAMPAAFVLVYGLSYFFTEFGPNVTTFVLSAELYPVSMRTTGDGISAGIGKLGAFTGVFIFPTLNAALGLRGTLLLSAGFCLAGAALSLVLPEPARRSLEDLSVDPLDIELASEPFALLRREQASRERAESIANAAAVFGSTLEGDQVLAELAIQARVGLRCDYAVALLVQESKVTLVHCAGVNEPELSELLDIVDTPALSLDALLEDDIKILLSRDKAHASAVERVELRSEGETIVICLRKARSQFSSDERSLLRAIAAQGSSALDNALLYQQSRRSESQYRQLVEQLPSVLYTRTAGAVVPSYVSPRIEQLLGVSQAQFLADPWSLVHPDDRDRVWRHSLDPLEAGKRVTEEYQMLRSVDEVIWVRDEWMLLPGPPVIVQGLLSDITARHTAQAEVEFLAYHDPVTRLANRRMFDELLDLAIARSLRHNSSVGILYIDLDSFKRVNDNFGHDVGDQLLAEVALRLESVVRVEDVVARHGGDEFLVLLGDLETPEDLHREPRAATPIAAAEATARRIHNAMREPVDLAGTQYVPTASIGIAIFPLNAESAATLVQAADAAMYMAKQNGRGQTESYSRAASATAERLILEERLRQAAKVNDWVLYYQPVVDLASARIVGVEALLRWRQPDGVLVAPGEFLTVAEELGLINQIGEWVFTEACRQSAEWSKQGRQWSMAINLSPLQLNDPRLASRLTEVAKSYGLPPGQLTIEITETETMVAPVASFAALQELREGGFSIAIDDFGTGYSSLTRLQQMPVDVLKIDRSFVDLLPHDQRAVGMVRAQIELAINLGLTCVAEGVETEAQRLFLIDAGCLIAQGYLFSRPVPAGDLSAGIIRYQPSRPLASVQLRH